MKFQIADMKSERVGQQFLVTLDVHLVDTQYDDTSIPDEVMRTSIKRGCAPDTTCLRVQSFFDSLPTMTEDEWRDWIVERLQRK